MELKKTKSTQGRARVEQSRRRRLLKTKRRKHRQEKEEDARALKIVKF